MPDYFDAGFSVREPMWHGLGTVLPDNPDWDEVPDLAGWPLHVVRRPVYFDPDPDGDRELILVEDQWALYDEARDEFVSTCSDTYGVVQPDTMVEVLRALAGAGAKPKTAGALHGYRQLWALAELSREFLMDGDTYLAYVSVHNSFDGSLAFQAGRHGVNVVCANTQDLALTESARRGTLYRWKHTSKVMERIEEAKAVVMGTEQAMQEFIDLAGDLAKRKVTPKAVNLFLTKFIPSPPEALVTDRAMANINEARAAVKDILSGATGTVQPKHSQTAYGLWCAGVEYLDYIRPARSKDTMFGRAILTPDKGKAHLLKLATAAAKA